MGITAKGKEKKPLNPEEVLELAKESGVELTDEQLEQVSGGWDITDDYIFCENCSSFIICKPEVEWVYCSECGHLNGPYEVD